MSIRSAVVTAAITVATVVGAASASAFSFPVPTFTGTAFGIGTALTGAGVSFSSSAVWFILLAIFVFAGLRLESAIVDLFVAGFLAVIADYNILISLLDSYA